MAILTHGDTHMVRDNGEFDRLRCLRPFLDGDSPAIPVGVGDDAAVVRIGGKPVVVCVDTLVEGVHFRRDLSTPADVGWKAVAVNVSDMAAMGAVPTAAVVALNRPADLSEADIEQLYRGMACAGDAYGLSIVGGDTVTSQEWAVSVTVFGDLEGRQAVTRAGAQVGDVVVLAGPIGQAAAALWADQHSEVVHPDHLAAHARPQALPATGVALARAGAHAMIDLSDGLGGDAAHLCRASGVSFELDRGAVERAVPEGVVTSVGEGWLDLAIGGGEDFALLATVSPQLIEGVIRAVSEAGEATGGVIGRVVEASQDAPAVWLVEGDTRRRIDHLGYDHG